MSGAQPPPYQELQPPSWTSSLPRPEPSQERYEDWLAYTSLRPSFLLAHGVATIVGIVLAAVQWYIVGYEREGPEALAIASATLFTVFFVFEACGFVAGCMSHTKLIWGFARFSILSYVLVVVAEVIALVNTYANKDKIKRHCVEDQTQNWNSSSNIYEHEAPPQDYCDSRWGTTAAWDVVWLILLVIFGAFFMHLRCASNSDYSRTRAHIAPMSLSSDKMVIRCSAFRPCIRTIWMRTTTRLVISSLRSARWRIASPIPLRGRRRQLASPCRRASYSVYTPLFEFYAALSREDKPWVRTS